MKRCKELCLGMTLSGLMMVPAVMASEGLDRAYGDLRLRLETVEQDNAAKDATALTLRSRLGYVTDSYKGFSARAEVENNMALVDNYFDAVDSGAGFSTVADPEFTELDQGFVQYQNKYIANGLTLKFGRQVLAYDNQRFIGHVGWRQDRQTFDGLSGVYQATDKLVVKLAYLEKRNRIFANEKDLDSQDWLLNAAYQTSLGKVTAYAYLLEVDNGSRNSLDTYGLIWAGKTTVGQKPLRYQLELATQSNTVGTAENDTHYMALSVATDIAAVSVTLGYEELGSDNAVVGFATPLATGHKFNGWTDPFLGTPKQGLIDSYVALGGKLLGGKWLLAYHDFAADKASATVDDLGSEVDLLYARKFQGGFSGGAKYAAYSAGDAAAGKVDTDKLWIWAAYSF